MFPESLIDGSIPTTEPATSVRIASACGNLLQVTKEARDMEFRTERGEVIRTNLLVVKGGPAYVILGVEVILSHTFLIREILNRSEYHHGYKVHGNGKKQIRSLTEGEFKIEVPDSIFITEIDKMALCVEGNHRIETGDHKPIYQRSARIPVHFESAIDEEIKKNLNLGIISKSQSDWCSRIVPVTKPDGSLRMCVNYRALNQITTKDRYPLPRIDEILDSLSGALYFTSLDATSGYYQISMCEADKKKTAFAWKGGLYEFNRMPFGLCNAPATFQRTMDKILAEERGKFVIPYLDDIIIYSKSSDEHIEHVKKVIGRLQNAGIKLNKNKCKFGKTEIKILGTVISQGNIRPDPEKVRTIKEFPLPETVRELRSFLGLVNFCREYIVDYAGIMRPLFALLKGEKKDSQRKIQANEEALKAFKRVKEVISEGLARAQPDPTKPFILTTDASEYGIGAVLSQKQKDGTEKMISAFSKNLDKAQLNYSVTDKELLGLVKGIENYRHYLLGSQFTLRTDHRALAYLWEAKNPCSRILRWSLKLQEYTFKVEYIKGETNIADACSRIKRINAVLKEPSVEEKSDLLREYHTASGHGTANTMKFLMMRRYKWHNIAKRY